MSKSICCDKKFYNVSNIRVSKNWLFIRKKDGSIRQIFFYPDENVSIRPDNNGWMITDNKLNLIKSSGKAFNIEIIEPNFILIEKQKLIYIGPGLSIDITNYNNNIELCIMKLKNQAS